MKVGTSLMLTLVSAVDFLLFVRSFLGGGGGSVFCDIIANVRVGKYSTVKKKKPHNYSVAK